MKIYEKLFLILALLASIICMILSMTLFYNLVAVLIFASVTFISAISLIIVILNETCNIKCGDNIQNSVLIVTRKQIVNEKNFFSLFSIKILAKRINKKKSIISVRVKPKSKKNMFQDISFDLILKDALNEIKIQEFLLSDSGVLNKKCELELDSFKNYVFHLSNIKGSVNRKIKKKGRVKMEQSNFLNKKIVDKFDGDNGNINNRTTNFLKPFFIGLSIPIILISLIFLVVFNVHFTYNMELDVSHASISFSPSESISLDEYNVYQLFNITGKVSKKINNEEMSFSFSVTPLLKNYNYENCILSFGYLSKPNQIEQIICELDKDGYGFVSVTKITKGISAKGSIFGILSVSGTMTK